MSRENQHYMTEAERHQLEAYLRAGKRVAWIAEELHCSKQTIYNEMSRGAIDSPPGYSAQVGQSHQKDHSQNKGCPSKLDTDAPLLLFLERKMLGEQDDGTIDSRKRYSPAAALQEARKAGYNVNINVKTVYNYIEKGKFKRITNADLWEKTKRKPHKKRKPPKIAHENLPNIEKRPKEIDKREEPGHWEMDLIQGKAGTKACLLTLTERTTREEIIIKLPNKKARTIRKAINRLERNTPNFSEKFKTVTTDNGSEFLEYEKLKKSAIHKGDRFKIYYCHSFASWEKGSNENHNRMIRRWFPKGTDFTKVSKTEIQDCQDWMNNYPRKILSWNNPLQETARRDPARLKPSRGVPLADSSFTAFTIFEPTTGRPFDTFHISLLRILLELQYFFLRHHLPFLHSVFKIPDTRQGVVSMIIAVTYKPAIAGKRTNKLCISGILKLPRIEHGLALKPPKFVTLCYITCYLSQKSVNMTEALRGIIQAYVIMTASEDSVQEQRVNVCLKIPAVHLYGKLIAQYQCYRQRIILIIIRFLLLRIQDNLLQRDKFLVGNGQCNIRDNLDTLCHNLLSPGTPYFLTIIMMIGGRNPMNSGKRLAFAEKSGIRNQFSSTAEIIIFPGEVVIDIPEAIPGEKQRVRNSTSECWEHHQAEARHKEKYWEHVTTSGSFRKIPQSSQLHQKRRKQELQIPPPVEDRESTPTDFQEEPYLIRQFEKIPLPRQP